MILDLSVGFRLPLQIINCIPAAGAQRNNMVFDIARAGADFPSRGRAGILGLELVQDGMGSVLAGLGWDDKPPSQKTN